MNSEIQPPGNHNQEQRVIEEAYAATLEPERLNNFEKYWESYLDTGLQDPSVKGPPASLPVMSVHISRAIDILETIRHKHRAESNAQNIVDSNYGFGFIVNQVGKIIASNADAVFATKHAATLADMSLDADSVSKIIDWMSVRHPKTQNPVLFINAYLGNEELSTCLFLTPVDLKAVEELIEEQFFLITSVEFEFNEEAIEPIQNAFSLTILKRM